MAGEHVGQVLEHPQRLNGARCPSSPQLLEIDAARAGSWQLIWAASARSVQLGGDQAGAELDAEAGRVELGLVDLAVVEGELGGGDGQLDGAGHHAQALATVLVDVVRGVEVVDFAGDADGQAGGVERPDGCECRCGLAAGGRQKVAASSRWR